MKITQIAVITCSLVLINTCHETRLAAKTKVQEKQNSLSVTVSNPADVQSLIDDTSNEVSLLAMNISRGNRSGNIKETATDRTVQIPQVQPIDDDYHDLPPVDTSWLQNLKMSLRQ